MQRQDARLPKATKQPKKKTGWKKYFAKRQLTESHDSNRVRAVTLYYASCCPRTHSEPEKNCYCQYCTVMNI